MPELPDPSPLPPAPEPTRALVDTGAFEIEYLRAGKGVPVVLLGRPERGEGGPHPMLTPLAERFRVVAATPPAPGEPPRPGADREAAFSGWLRQFLDGLGLSRAHLVAEPPWALAALSFALTDPARVDRLALLLEGPVDPVLRAPPPPDVLGRSGHPLLVLRLPRGDRGAGVSELLEFLTR